MRDIYARHKAACKNADKPNARQKFGCGCPIYGRITIQDPVTRDILFDHNGSLTKFGATTLETAEALVDSWTLKYLSGEKPPAHLQESSLTVEEAVSKYLAYKATRYNVRWTPPAEREGWTADQRKQDRQYRADLSHKQQASLETLRKLEDALCGLPAFCEERKVTMLSDVDDSLLVAYQGTWQGKRTKDRATGKWIQLPKSPHSKQKYQRDIQALFTYWHDRGKIRVNVGRLLDPISLPPSEIHVYTPEQVRAVFTAIRGVFPQIPDLVEAFLLTQMYTAFRMSDMVTLECSSVPKPNEAGGATKVQWKTNNGVYAELPSWVAEKLHGVEPISRRYFFWSGTGTVETKAKDWSAKLLKVFRAAGIPDSFRSHAFRDTLATTILERPGTTLEDAQLALGHTSSQTTQRYYVALTRKRAERTNAIKREMWEDDPLYTALKPRKN